MYDVKSDPRPIEDLGMKVGSRHTKCPAHGGSDSVSCSVRGGVILWKCHSCGAGGTVVDAYMAAHSLPFSEAIKRLTAQYGDGTEARIVKTFTDMEKQKVQIIPTNLSPHLPSTKTFLHVDKDTKQKIRLSVKDATTWIAPCIVDDQLMAAAALRWDLSDGSKVMRQAHFDGSSWKSSGFPYTPCPLYKEMEIAKATDVIFVEGEKCMDALQKALGDSYVVTTLVGGSKAWNKSNKEALIGKNLIILPDYDDPGFKLAKSIKEDVGGKIIVLGDESKPRGYDVADYLKEGRDVMEIFEKDELTYEREDEPRTLDWAKEAASIVTVDGLKDFFTSVYHLAPNPVQLDEIIDIVKSNLQLNKNAIKALWREVEAENAIDYPDVVAKKVKDELYAGNVFYWSRIFWIYNNKYWQQVDDEFLKRRLLDVARDLVPTSSRNDLEAVMRKSFAILKAISARREDYLGFTESAKPIINVANGELHIRPNGDVELLPHNPESKLTYCLDVEYDESAECPIWDKALSEIMCGDKDLIRHFEEVAGYLIQPERKMKHFFLWYGQKGNNGKSLAKSVVSSLIGARNILSVKINKFGAGAHDEHMLVGKMLLVDDDMEKGIKLNDGLIKTISEQKMLTANPKQRDTFQFTSFAAILLLSNHWPTTVDLTQAMVTRASIIPFNAYFDPTSKSTDRDLLDKIVSNELSGVLNSFLAGLKRLKTRGGWQKPKAVIDATHQWLVHTNVLYGFITSTLLDFNKGDVLGSALMDRYREWCGREGIRRPVQARTMRGYLEEMGYDINMEGEDWKVLNVRLS